MAIQQKLHTKLVQKLILTPSLQQAIKLLPMSTLELADLLNQEMVENPLLEEVPDRGAPARRTAAGRRSPRPRSPPPKRPTPGTTPTTSTSSATTSTTATARARRQEVKELPPIENTLSTAGSLADHLLWQLSLQTRRRDDCGRSARAIIGNLDDDGYLVASVEEIAAMGDWPVADVERALQHVQTFDPIGVAARDLQECLWLQLRHLGLEGTPDREDRHRAPAAAAEPPGPGDRAQARDDDRGSEGAHRDHPQPRSEAGQPLQPVAVAVRHPDVYVVKVEDQYVAVLNEEGLPQLRISPVYRRLLDKSGAARTTTRRAPT